MKKIIHLSDLHVGHEDCGNRFRTIIEKLTSFHQPDDFIIVITGDIVDNANHKEQTEEAVGGIEMLEKTGFRVLVVPGNHDYGNGAYGKPEFVGYFKKKFYRSVRIGYPKLDIIDGAAFIGLDSTAEELHGIDRLFSEGELGKKQLNRLRRILKRPDLSRLKKIVYLHHHPFDFKLGMQLKDSNDLKGIIENNADVLLFGHYHVDPLSAGKIYNGTWGIRRCYNAGSSTHKNGNVGFQRIIDPGNDDTGADYDGKFL